MQSDFQMLVVSKADVRQLHYRNPRRRELGLLGQFEDLSIVRPVDGTSFSQSTVENLEIDIATLKKIYTNISEDVLVFLIHQHQAAGHNISFTTKQEESGSTGSDGSKGRADKVQSASAACASTLLPPPKRFNRAARNASQIAK